MIAAITGFLANLFESLWNAFLAIIYKLAQWGLDLLNAILVFCVSLVADLFGWLVSLLPDLPQIPTAGPIPELFATANYFAPVSEALGLLALLAAIYAIRGAIEFVKFLRGA